MLRTATVHPVLPPGLETGATCCYLLNNNNGMAYANE
jgi:hypothetical protein